ncbi:MAG: hypothetical protein HOH74_12580, partial [Gemmatimonadetes bacterium]|nr:hypothetical protein [Gemmatimonadota bacterium]
MTNWSLAPRAIWGGGRKGVMLAFGDGLASVQGEVVDYVSRTSVDAAAPGPDDAIYITRGPHVLRFGAELHGEPDDVTAVFGVPSHAGRVLRGPCGEVFVEGCARHRRLNGTYTQQAPTEDGAIPLPMAADLYGNRWSLLAHASGTQVLVLPANAPEMWQVAHLESGQWDHLVVDCDGFLWIAGPVGARCFWPRDDHGKGWQTPDGPAAHGAVTALGSSPDGHALLALATGDLLQLDIDVTGKTLQQRLAQLPAAARCLHTDEEGTIWAATDDGLYRQPPPAPTWHAQWRQQPGRLPGGGNHDIFSVPWQGQLY